MIDQIHLDRVRIPLTEPYRLSTVTVNEFDVAIVRVTTSDGATGLGEVTSLKRYSAEDGDAVWKNLQQVSDDLIGKSTADATSYVKRALDGFPFSATGLISAIETAENDKWTSVTAPIAGILSANDPVEYRHQSLLNQLDTGFETIKVKIGFDPVSDAEVLEELVKIAPETTSFRVDANQGYSLEEAQMFLERAPTHQLEHFEQPLPVGNLDRHAELRAESRVDIILDEEITTSEDMDAADQYDAADGVKFKLMKCGGIQRTRELITDASSRGYTVIFGNGVQSEIGSLLEAIIWAEMGLDTVGEFNGWHKQFATILENSPNLNNGQLHWEGTPKLSDTALNQYGIDVAHFGGTSHA